MKNAGYAYQIAEGWQTINPDSVLVGRAVTATLCRVAPTCGRANRSIGKESKEREDKILGPVDLLVKGDVYVANQFGAN